MKNVLIYTVHKAASMFLHKLGMDLAKRLELDSYSINDKEYYDKIKNSSWKAFIESTTGPSCFGPIRAGEDELERNPRARSAVLRVAERVA